MTLGLKFGLLGGAAVSAWLLAASLVGFHTQRLEFVKYSGTLGFAVLAGFIFLGLKSARARSPDGSLTLEQGWRLGTFIALGSAAVVALFKVAYNQFINPGWIGKAIEWERARLSAAGATEQAVARMEAAFRATNSHAFILTLDVLQTVVLGTFIALALAIALRHDETPAPSSP